MKSSSYLRRAVKKVMRLRSKLKKMDERIVRVEQRVGAGPTRLGPRSPPYAASHLACSTCFFSQIGSCDAVSNVC